MCSEAEQRSRKYCWKVRQEEDLELIDPSLESRVSWKDTTKQTPGLFLPRLLALVPHLQAASCLGDLTSQWLLNPSTSLQVYCQRVSPSHSPGLDHEREAALYQVSLHPCNPAILSSLEARVISSTCKWEHVTTILKLLHPVVKTPRSHC